MRLLTEADYRTEAEPALRRLFLNDSPRNQKFGVNAESRKLLYEYRTPNQQILEIIVQTASKLGDKGFYLSVLVREDVENLRNFNHWWVPFDEVSLYLSNALDIFNFANHFENVIYSPRGQWGLMWSFENFGLLVGVNEFINKACQYLPGIEKQVDDFLKYTNECKKKWGDQNINIDWLPGLLEQMYGSETAQKMLRAID